MIYNDFYDFLMKKSSAKEFDIVLNLLNNTDWNSNVQIDYYRLAKQSQTTVKYVKDVFRKFLSFKKGKRILAHNLAGGEDVYKLLLGKSNLFYNQGDRYCKKYAFFYSNVFKNLSIYSKRILLAAAMEVSNSNGNEAFIQKDYFVFKNELSSGLIPNNHLLYRSIQEIQNAFGEEITISLTSTLMRRREALYINFYPDLLEDVKHNHTERKILRETLFENGYYQGISDDHCIEIEKTGKYIFNSLFKYAKEYQKKEEIKSNLIDHSLKTARYIYNEAIKKMAKYIKTHNFAEKNPEELSAYLSSVAFEITIGEMNKWNHQYESIKRLYDNSLLETDLDPEYTKTIKERYLFYLAMSSILKKWANNWVISRGNVPNEDRKVNNDRNIDRLTQLKETISNAADRVENKIIERGNNIFTIKERTKYIRTFKQQAIDFIDIQLERLQNAFLAS